MRQKPLLLMLPAVLAFAAMLLAAALAARGESDGASPEYRPEDRYDERHLEPPGLPPWNPRAVPSARREYKQPGQRWDTRTRRWESQPYPPAVPGARAPERGKGDVYEGYRSPFAKPPAGGRSGSGYRQPWRGR